MRWIVASLILLNLLYFAWNYWQQLQGPAEQKVVVTPVVEHESGGRLVLLTERLPAPTSPAPPPTIAPKPPLSAKKEAVDRKVCARLGPYSDQEKAAFAVRSLVNASVGATLREAVDLQSRQYWVILPQAGSRQRALQLLKELQARSIDSFLVTEGELSNAISLGLFNREALAMAVRNKVQEAGYNAEIRIKERSEKAYWIQLSFEQASENARKVLDELVSDEDGIKILNTPCETFAQTN